MVLTKKQREEFERIARPLMKWISDNCHPHCNVIVDYTCAKLNEGVATIITEDFVKD